MPDKKFDFVGAADAVMFDAAELGFEAVEAKLRVGAQTYLREHTDAGAEELHDYLGLASEHLKTTRNIGSQPRLLPTWVTVAAGGGGGVAIIALGTAMISKPLVVAAFGAVAGILAAAGTEALRRNRNAVTMRTFATNYPRDLADSYLQQYDRLVGNYQKAINDFAPETVNHE